MRFMVSTTAATALLLGSTAAHAGGLSDEIMEAPVVVEQPAPAPAGPSISPTYVVLGVLAALLIAAAVAEDDDDDEQDEPQGIELSDIKLKTDIAEIGTSPSGLTIYSYRYLGHDALFSGVMAQEVLNHTPEAVVALPGGFLAVDYGQIDVEMTRLQ